MSSQPKLSPQAEAPLASQGKGLPQRQGPALSPTSASWPQED